MWRRLSLLVLCCAVSGLGALEADGSHDPSPEEILHTEASVAGKPDQDAPPAATAADREQQPTAEPLEDELDNQENIISQVSVV